MHCEPPLFNSVSLVRLLFRSVIHLRVLYSIPTKLVQLLSVVLSQQPLQQ